MSERDFAAHAGISLTTYIGIERHSYDVTETLMKSLQLKYGVDPVWFLTGKGPRLRCLVPLVCQDVSNKSARRNPSRNRVEVLQRQVRKGRLTKVDAILLLAQHYREEIESAA